ncbi:hypothetical protein BLOT_009494 [Blomia tropicalis]|nr:hypothetical protein BLOT_009494 [Blomia tropicalis]
MNQFGIKLMLLIVVLEYSTESIKSINCKHILPSSEGRIYNGRKVRINEVPYIVQILDNPHSKPFCSGILVSSTKVITSAHCVYDIEEHSFEKRVYVRYGTAWSNLSSYPVKNVTKIIRHGNFKVFGKMNIPINDIAIIILQEPIYRSFRVGYARLPTYEFDGAFTVSIFGWGHMDVNESSSIDLLKSTMRTKRTADCVKAWNPGCFSVKHCQHICAIAEYTATGDGDSGGPVVFPDGTVVGMIMFELDLEQDPDVPPWEERLFLRLFGYLNFIHLRERDHLINNELKIKSISQNHHLPSDVGRIFNGKEAPISEVPYLVQILNASHTLPFCGGILIDHKKVVTAAHCVYCEVRKVFLYKRLFIRYGTSLIETSIYREVEVSRILLHHQYGMVRTTLVNDIVVLILNSSIPKSHNVDYAKLPYKDFDGIFTISTYGNNTGTERGDSGGPAVFNDGTVIGMSVTRVRRYTSQLIIKSSNRDHIKPSNVGRIINGRNASITEVPYLVQILDHPNALPICGGILIAPTKVITSAHCVYDDDKKSFEERLYIRYGTSLSLWSLFPVIPVSRIVVHRNYDWINQGQENDIAILILKEKILQKNGIEYARLPTYEFDGEFFVSIYGWGDVAEGGPSSYILLKTTMKTMTTSDCVKRGNRGCLSENECKIICATSDDTGGGDGDSGGPVVSYRFYLCFLRYTSQLIIKSSNHDYIKPSNVGRIINGKNVSITEVPYLVQILKDSNNSLPICGGILIAPTKVITSAHCVYNNDTQSFEERLYIRYGTPLAFWSLFPVIPVSRIVVHRNYDWINQGEENDIAILILKEKIPQKNGIEYARLPTYEFDGEFFVSIYGWGRVTDDGPRSYFLLKTTMVTMTISDCAKRGNRACLSENECKIICAVSDNTGGGDGDSGGPVVFPDGTVVGIYAEKIYTNSSMDEEEPWQERIFLRTFSYRNFISLQELRHFHKWLDT